jgi:hypothetical protein
MRGHVRKITIFSLLSILSGCGSGCSDAPPIPGPVERVAERVQEDWKALDARIASAARDVKSLIARMTEITGRVDNLEDRVRNLEDRMGSEWTVDETEKGGTL